MHEAHNQDVSYLFEPEKCFVVIAAYPDLQVAPQLIAWLHFVGVAHIEVHRWGDGRMDCGYNKGIELALASAFQHFIFADKDIWPDDNSLPFLAAEADVVSCEYDTGIPGAWDRPNSFHTGLWRCRRRVLEAVGFRPFQWQLNETGTGVTECLCPRFARRAEARGFSIEHAGTAIHIPRPKSPLPDTTTLAVPK